MSLSETEMAYFHSMWMMSFLWVMENMHLILTNNMYIHMTLRYQAKGVRNPVWVHESQISFNATLHWKLIRWLSCETGDLYVAAWLWIRSFSISCHDYIKVGISKVMHFYTRIHTFGVFQEQFRKVHPSQGWPPSEKNATCESGNRVVSTYERTIEWTVWFQYTHFQTSLSRDINIWWGFLVGGYLHF